MTTIALPGMPGIHANSGGPMSRTRRERIKSSLLGSGSGVVRCPRRISLCLSFERDPLWGLPPLEELLTGKKRQQTPEELEGQRRSQLTPVEYLEELLKDEGFRDPEELRERYALPEHKLICGPWTGMEDPLFVHQSSNHEVLRQSLMLGLCTAQMFDPGRPVLWTETSLTRAVELFDPGSFYA